MRAVMVRVLPVPAPARMSTGPLMCMTASRCWGLSIPIPKAAFIRSGAGWRKVFRCGQLAPVRQHLGQEPVLLLLDACMQRLFRIAGKDGHGSLGENAAGIDLGVHEVHG